MAPPSPATGAPSSAAAASPPPPPPFDLDAYASRYDPRSETRLQRLLFLAHQFHDAAEAQAQTDPAAAAIASDNAQRAFELAVARMKESGNFRRYLEEYGAVADAPASPPPEQPAGGDSAAEQQRTPLRPSHAPPPKHVIQQYLPYDPDFAMRARVESAQRGETMEARLATAQSHLMKESIRTALLALAEFHAERGELREAWRRVSRSREYCANGRQHTQVCLLLVELSVDLREWSNVRDAVSRAEHTVGGDVDHDPLFRQKLRAGQALAHLAEGRYREAATGLTSLSTELTTQFSSVISAEDLATYGSVLGLATMDRDALHAAVLDGEFKGRLELVPHVKEALRHYARAEYGPCLALLQHTLRRDLEWDIHLRPHVPILLDMIRDRCIAQYLRPYSSASLERMGNVFGCTAQEMETAVAGLIAGGRGPSLGDGARIDALAKTVTVESPKSKDRKARRRARAAAAKMGVHFARTAEGMLLKVACAEAGIAVAGNQRGGWRGRRSGRGGGSASGRDLLEDAMEGNPYRSDDDSVSDDAMEVDDHHVVNPNEF
ncbi:hypothetical protein ACHAXT_005756 [Thalassiosira profunda]